MAIVEGATVRLGPGWGCSCKAFRQGIPDDNALLAGIARASLVEYKYLGYKDGVHSFRANSIDTPQSPYHVTCDPEQPGGVV